MNKFLQAIIDVLDLIFSFAVLILAGAIVSFFIFIFALIFPFILIWCVIENVYNYFSKKNGGG